MYKVLGIVALITFSFVISIYFGVNNISIDEATYGPRGVLLFVIPFIMLLINSNLIILPKVIQGSYSRYKSGMESIFLSLSIILFILHCGILLVATGSNINLFSLIPLSVGIVLITTANTLPRFVLELNENTAPVYQSSNHVWNIIIRPFSFPLFIGGTTMLFCIFLPGHLLLIGFFFILVCTLIISTFMSYRAYQAQC